jgi:CRISPR-associated protein Cas2
MLVAIVYDISDDARRYHLAKLLSSFGDRVQYSLFEAELSDSQFSSLQQSVARIISSDTDRVRYYLLGSKPETRVKIEGLGKHTQKLDFILV